MSRDQRDRSRSHGKRTAKVPGGYCCGFSRVENGDRGQSTREVAAPAQCAWRAAPHDLAYQCSPVPSGRRTSGYVGNSAYNRNPCEKPRAVARRRSGGNKKGNGPRGSRRR